MDKTTGSFDIDAITDPGRVRSENQDAYGRADEILGKQQRALRERYGRLYVVADGVGGNADGAAASKFVVRRVVEHFYYDTDLPTAPAQRLREAVERTSRDLYEEASRRNSNMASTIVAALLHDNKLTIANVGDSPALLLHQGRAPEQLSEDHVATFDDGGEGLAQAMGDPKVRSFVRTVDFAPDDIVLLCTDGLTRHLDRDEIGRILARSNAHDAKNELVRRANARGGSDNITALVLRNGPPPTAAWGGRRGTLLIGALVLVALLMLLAFLNYRQGTPDDQLPTPEVPTTIQGGVATDVAGGDTPTPAPLPTSTPTNTPLPTSTPTNTPLPTSTPTITPTITRRPATVTSRQPSPTPAQPTDATVTPIPLTESPILIETLAPSETPAPPTQDPNLLVMPAVVGLGENQARELLAGRGFVGSVTTNYQCPAQIGDIYNQFPAYAVVSSRPDAGTEVLRDTPINLAIRAPEADCGLPVPSPAPAP